jgi:hypothetical protein
VGTRNHEETLSKVGGSNCPRRYNLPLRIPPDEVKITQDRFEPQTKVSCDIFHDEELGSNFPNDSQYLRPQVSLVFFAQTFSGTGERLAGVSCRDDIHSLQWSSVQVFDISDPYRSFAQLRVLHPAQQDGRCIAVPLNVTHRAGFKDV